MALPTITFNSGTGSDTAASGAGPGTALFGTAAATVAANNVVTLSVDSPNLTGVATDGSAAIYVNSSTGRKWSKITAVDNALKTVTCQDNFANTEGTRGWGIGGKRATFGSSAQLGADLYEGWTITIEADDTTGGLAIAATASAADGKLIIQGDSATTRRTITQPANAGVFSMSTAVEVEYRNLKFANSNGTKTAAVGVSFGASVLAVWRNCIFGDATNKLTAAATRTSGSPQITFDDCELTTLVTGSLLTGTNIQARYFACWIHGGTSHGITGAGTANNVIDCLITGNGGDGVNIGATPLNMFHGNTIHGNTGDGLDSSSSTGLGHIYNNIFTGNGGFGWNSVANSDNLVQLNKYNNYGTGATANTSGARNNISAGSGDLAVDPGYTATGSNNYGVGTAMIALGAPDSTKVIGAGQSGTTSYVEMGAAQRRETTSFPAVIKRAATVMKM